MCLSYPNCETGHRLVRGVYALITALGLGFNRVLRLSSSLMPLVFLPMVLPLPTLMSQYVIIRGALVEVFETFIHTDSLPEVPGLTRRRDCRGHWHMNTMDR